MPKRLELSPHASTEELERLYRKAKDPVERSHRQIVWLLGEGKTTGEVCEVTGYSPGWVRRIARRYNERGIEGLGDRRHGNPGARERALLNEEGQEELREALLSGPPPGGGMWSGPKVAHWIEERNGLEKVHAQRGFEYLRRVGMSPQVPRPANARADPEAREAFKKSLPLKLEKLEEAHPEAEVELWAQDEARLGLKPVVRRAWAPVGKRPVARAKRGYEWTYLYGFVRPQSGQVFWLVLPTVNVELFSMALREFAREIGAGEDKRILLVLDRAGWHTGGEVEVPDGIHLEFLPSGSPELQPAERLWPLTNEAIANRLFEEIEQVEQALVERCVELLDQAETIRGLTNYHWWPQAA